MMRPTSGAAFEEKRGTTVIDFPRFSTKSGKLHRRTALAECRLNECSVRASVTIESRALCFDHFISYCYSRLQEWDQVKPGSTAAESASHSPSTNNFRDDCRSIVTSLLIVRTELPNIDRARLLDILLWATELIEKERRWWPIPKSAPLGQRKL
jgi:hypothetical protein